MKPVAFHCECGCVISLSASCVFNCPLCEKQCEFVCEQQQEPTRWPLWATLVRWKATGEDTGVGDTVHRMLGQLGEEFKTWAERLGIPCGCAARQEEWNQRFPY